MGAIVKDSLIYIFWPAGLGISILFAHKPGWMFLFFKPYTSLRKEIYPAYFSSPHLLFDTLWQNMAEVAKAMCRHWCCHVSDVKFFHPSKPICDKHPNRPKNHKLQGVVLAEVDAKAMRQGANAILVFVITHFDYPEPTILRRQAIHPWDQIGWRGQPICLSRGWHPRFQR